MKKYLAYIIYILCIPLALLLGSAVFHDKPYAFITLIVAALGCVPFFISFESKSHDTTKLILIAVLTALSVVGRLLFAPIQGFKPVTAMVIIAAIYFGGEVGFMVGAFTAVLSNFYFGQGPWTPFQMFTWGLIGLIAGLCASKLKKNKLALCIYGALAGIAYSLLMDVWTVLWWDGDFNLSRYKAAIVSSLGYMAIYAASNVIFLLLLQKPIGQKLERIKNKYGI